MPPMAQHDHVGFFRDFHGLGDLFAVFLRIAGHHRIDVPGAADGDLAALAVQHLHMLADLGLNAFEHGDVVVGDAAVTAQQAAMRIRSDDRDGLDALRDSTARCRSRSSAA